MKKLINLKKNNKYLSPVFDNNGALKGFRFTPGPTLRAQGIKPQMLKMPNGEFMDITTARIARDTILRTATPIIAKPKTTNKSNTLTLKSGFALFETYFSKKITAGSRSKASLKTYSEHIKAWYDYFGENANLHEIDNDLVQEAVNLMADEGVKPANLRGRLATISVTLKYLKKHIDKTLCRIEDIEIEPPAIRLLIPTDQEIAFLINCADQLATETKNQNYKSVGTAIIAAIWTCQRIGDILQCDLDKQLFNENNRDRLFFNQQKTNAQIMIPILPPLAQRIDKQKNGMLIKKQNHNWQYPSFREHWAKVRKYAYEKLNKSKIIPKGIDKEKILKLHFHDFRGASITRLYAAGCTPIDIASWSGHTIQTINNMLKIYCQYQQDRADKAGDILYDYFKQNKIHY